MKLHAHRAELPGHAVASRKRAKEILFTLCPLPPTYKAGLAGHLPASPETGKWTNSSFQERNTRFREE
jgi:hypothetical protein